MNVCVSVTSSHLISSPLSCHWHCSVVAMPADIAFFLEFFLPDLKGARLDWSRSLIRICHDINNYRVAIANKRAVAYGRIVPRKG